jgi:hypothetical protein
LKEDDGNAAAQPTTPTPSDALQTEETDGFQRWLRDRGPGVHVTAENLKEHVPHPVYEHIRTVPAQPKEAAPPYPEFMDYSLLAGIGELLADTGG